MATPSSAFPSSYFSSISLIVITGSGSGVGGGGVAVDGCDGWDWVSGFSGEEDGWHAVNRVPKSRRTVNKVNTILFIVTSFKSDSLMQSYTRTQKLCNLSE
jgi:hypothetical protein